MKFASVSGRSSHVQRNSQLVCAVAFVAMLTHALGLVQPSLAATSSSQQSENAAAAASTQPLWSYQVKPASYVGAGGPGQAPAGNGYSMGGPASIFDAFTGLSQRQGALTSSPFLSILPIILIAAGGLLLLLPMLTMMMASPFGGSPFGAGGGYQNYGYPQVNKRRSLDSGVPGANRGLIELIEHVSSTIEDLSRKYAPGTGVSGQQQQQQQQNGSNQSAASGAAAVPHKRSAKALNGNGGPNNLAANHQPANELSLPQAGAASNHKQADDATNSANSLSNLAGGSL